MDDEASKQLLQDLDLAPYAGRWIAVVRGTITGVGVSAQEARIASKSLRPKDEPLILFVSDEQNHP